MTSSFWRSVVSVLSGTALAQVIPVLGSLVIARQYAPADFGLFAAWLGLMLVLAVMLTGRFETALAIEADGEPRRLATISTLLTSLLTASLAGIVVATVVASGMAPSSLDRFPSLMIGVSVPTALTIAMAQTWQSWAAAEGNYRALSVMRIAQAAAVTIAQIGVGVLHPTASALALAHMFGVFTGLLVSAFLMPIGKLPTARLSTLLRAFWSRHRRFPAYSLPADSINTAVAQLPVLIVASRFGVDIAGLLALTLRTLGAPIGLLGKSVLDVFKRHAAASFRARGECRDDYVRTFSVLLLASLAFCVVMALSSETLFAFAFGETWRAAGTFAVWLLPLFALRFMASPLSYMVYIAGKQHVDLVWQVCLLVVTLACLSLPQRYDVALQAYSAGYSLLYVVYLAMSYRFSLGEAR